MNKLSLNTKSLLIMGIINATPDSFSGDGIFKNNKFSLEKELDNIDIPDVSSIKSELAAIKVQLSDSKEDIEELKEKIEELQKDGNPLAN